MLSPVLCKNCRGNPNKKKSPKERFSVYLSRNFDLLLRQIVEWIDRRADRNILQAGNLFRSDYLE